MKFKTKKKKIKEPITREEKLHSMHLKEEEIDWYISTYVLYEKGIFMCDMVPLSKAESIIKAGLVTQEYVDNKMKKVDEMKALGKTSMEIKENI